MRDEREGEEEEGEMRGRLGVADGGVDVTWRGFGVGMVVEEGGVGSRGMFKRTGEE